VVGGVGGGGGGGVGYIFKGGGVGVGGVVFLFFWCLGGVGGVFVCGGVVCVGGWVWVGGGGGWGFVGNDWGAKHSVQGAPSHDCSLKGSGRKNDQINRKPTAETGNSDKSGVDFTSKKTATPPDSAKGTGNYDRP